MKFARGAVAAAIILLTGQPSVAQDQCLTASELSNVARMGATMGLGGALRRCQSCLGERYQPIVDKYEATGMLAEFRRSEAAIQSSRSKFEFADELVRLAARRSASDLSASCKACEDTATRVEELSSMEAQDALYRSTAERVAQFPSYKKCQ